MVEYFITQNCIVQPTFGALHFAHQTHISKFALHLCIVVYILHMPNMRSRLYKFWTDIKLLIPVDGIINLPTWRLSYKKTVMNSIGVNNKCNLKLLTADVHCTLLACHFVLSAALSYGQVTNDDRRRYEQERLAAVGPISWPSHCH
jgi:hypothetical protein